MKPLLEGPRGCVGCTTPVTSEVDGHFIPKITLRTEGNLPNTSP
jgi:hypothetical protein